MKHVLVLVFSVFFFGCSHTISLRGSHFNVPVTAEKQFGGHVGLVYSSNTQVELINDLTSNPPKRDVVLINESLTKDVSEALIVPNLGVDASLNLVRNFDVIMTGSMLGAKFQFLNGSLFNFSDSEANSEKWVGSVIYESAKKTGATLTESDNSSNEASSDVNSQQFGISVGYLMEGGVPYVSYIQESHSVKTLVKQGSSSFGPYSDDGVHRYYTIGYASPLKSGFVWAIEANQVLIKWDRSDLTSQTTFGFKLGAGW